MSEPKLSGPQSEPTKVADEATPEEPAKKPSAEKEPAKKPSTEKEPAKKPSTEKEPAKKPSTEKEPAKKPSAEEEPAKKPSAEKEPAEPAVAALSDGTDSNPSQRKASSPGSKDGAEGHPEKAPESPTDSKDEDPRKGSPSSRKESIGKDDDPSKEHHHHHHRKSTATETEYHHQRKHSRKSSDRPGHHHRRHSRRESEGADLEELEAEEEADAETEGSFDMAAFKRQMSVTWQKNQLPSFLDPFKGDTADIQKMFGMSFHADDGGDTDDEPKASISTEPPSKESRLPKEWLVNCKTDGGKVVEGVYKVDLSPQLSIDSVSNNNDRVSKNYKIPPYTQSDGNKQWGVKDSVRAIRGSNVQTNVSAVPSTRSITSRYTRGSQKLSSVASFMTGVSGFDADEMPIWVPGRHFDHVSEPNKRHFIKIINTLNYDIKVLESTQGTLLKDVRECYRFYNPNIDNYRWTDSYEKPLDFELTLHENGLVDNSYITDEIGLDYYPLIYLFFMDGFENDPPMQLDIRKAFIRDPDILCRNYQLGLKEYNPEDYETEMEPMALKEDMNLRKLLVFHAPIPVPGPKAKTAKVDTDGEEEEPGEDEWEEEQEDEEEEEQEEEQEEEEEEQEEEQEQTEKPSDKECKKRRPS